MNVELKKSVYLSSDLKSKAIRLRQGTASELNDDEFHVELIKEIQLPFTPIAGISLGLEENSDFLADEERIEKVMWQHINQKFLVQLEKSQCSDRKMAESVVSYFLKRDWKFRVLDCFSDLESANQFLILDGDTNRTVIEIESKFAVVDEPELWTLNQSGQKYILHPTFH